MTYSYAYPYQIYVTSMKKHILVFYTISKLGRFKENIFATECTEKHLQINGYRTSLNGLKTVRHLVMSEMPKDPT